MADAILQWKGWGMLATKQGSKVHGFISGVELGVADFIKVDCPCGRPDCHGILVAVDCVAAIVPSSFEQVAAAVGVKHEPAAQATATAAPTFNAANVANSINDAVKKLRADVAGQGGDVQKRFVVVEVQGDDAASVLEQIAEQCMAKAKAM
jgi:translation initiation factor 1 (eIF-1/SUI1)